MIYNYKNPGIAAMVLYLLIDKEEYAALLLMTQDGSAIDMQTMQQNWQRAPTLWHVLQVMAEDSMLALQCEHMRIRLNLTTSATAPLVTDKGIHKFLVRMQITPAGLALID